VCHLGKAVLVVVKGGAETFNGLQKAERTTTGSPSKRLKVERGGGGEGNVWRSGY